MWLIYEGAGRKNLVLHLVENFIHRGAVNKASLAKVKKQIEKSTFPRTCPFDLKFRTCNLIEIPNTKFYGFTSNFGV